MDSKYKYWILIGILFIFLIILVKNKHDTEDTEIEEGFEDNYEEDEKVKLSNLLGLLLDDQNFANQIIIDYNLKSIRDLVDKNVKNIDLNLKPILRNDQFTIVNRYLLLNDIYFTGKEQELNRIVTLSRAKSLVKPSEIYTNDITFENKQLDSFRQNYHLNKMMYISYTWVSDKIKRFINNYGLVMVSKSQDNMKEIFGKNYWEGYRYLTKSNFFDYPINTVLYMKENQELCLKVANDKWFITAFNIENTGNTNTNVSIIKRIINNPESNWKYWTDLFNNANTKATTDTNSLIANSNMNSGNYLWVRSSSEYDTARLYQKIDEMSQNGFFTGTGYDKLIKLPSDLELVYTQVERMKLLKKWVESFAGKQQKLFLENIIIDLNQRIINMFDDIVCYLVFYQIEDFAELYLDKYIRLNDTVNRWWSGKNFAEILQNAINLGQCFLPAVFSISKIQETPPVFKFLYNKNLYHTFWDPLQIYISDMEKFLSNKFKTKEVARIAPVARFCAFNNNSLRDYLAKYITCTTNKCLTDLSSLREPERCGALKLKYQELLTQRMRFKCTISSFQDEDNMESTDNTKMNMTEEERKADTNTKEETKINQVFGFNNLLLLNLVEYAIKYHNCQTESIKIENCQDLSDKIDTADQKDDLKLGEVIVDRHTDLFNIYDQQIDEYNKIIHSQEVKKLEPLNLLANLEEKTKRERNRQFNMFNKSADDFYSIVNDFTNLGYKTMDKNQIEPFDNQLDDNMDLSENTFDKYKARIKRQLKGLASEENIGYVKQVQNIFTQSVNILTKDGRIMTSGMMLLIIAFCIYFIDISS
jgi:hypothetical protein